MKNPNVVGQHTSAQCRDCGDLFSYEYRGKTRSVCGTCLTANATTASKRYQRAMVRQPGEPIFTTRAHGCAAVLSHPDVRHVLAFWEAADNLLANGGSLESLENPQPLSTQAIQQLERRALLKLRKALGKEWDDYKKETNEKVA